MSIWDSKALKATPTGSDEVLIIDVADSRNQKRATITTLPLSPTPTITSFINATHNHQNGAGGGQLNSTLVLSDTDDIAYLNSVNNFGNFAQNFNNGVIGINNPAQTSKYTFLSSAILANRNITLPLLTGNDNFVFEAHSQTLTNKTLGTTTMSDGANIALNTTTGTKIATATAQKLGFWNATPVVQPSHIADPTGGATVDSEARTAINSILAQMATTGMQASS